MARQFSGFEDEEIKWEVINIDPQVYLDEERRKKERLELLGSKLNKFIAERNISFNLQLVFWRWRLTIEEMRKDNEVHITSIGRLRQFLKNAMGFGDNKGGSSSASTAAQSSEGKSTDEAEKVDKEEVRSLGGPGSKSKDGGKYQAAEGDNDLDIIEPDAYTKNKLIPNCFGVYKPN